MQTHCMACECDCMHLVCGIAGIAGNTMDYCISCIVQRNQTQLGRVKDGPIMGYCKSDSL